MALKSNLDAVPFIIYQLVGSSMQVSTLISPRDLKEMEIHLRHLGNIKAGMQEKGSRVCVILSDLEFDGDDHRGQIFVQLLQHDQLLQGQVEQPEEKQKENVVAYVQDVTVRPTQEPHTQHQTTQLHSFILRISRSLNWDLKISA